MFVLAAVAVVVAIVVVVAESVGIVVFWLREGCLINKVRGFKFQIKSIDLKENTGYGLSDLCQKGRNKRNIYAKSHKSALFETILRCASKNSW